MEKLEAMMTCTYYCDGRNAKIRARRTSTDRPCDAIDVNWDFTIYLDRAQTTQLRDALTALIDSPIAEQSQPESLTAGHPRESQSPEQGPKSEPEVGA